jgi:hypothetical protein
MFRADKIMSNLFRFGSQLLLMCLANGENAVRKGNYSILPDKFARLLYEFHDFQFAGLDIPRLPPD